MFGCYTGLGFKNNIPLNKLFIPDKYNFISACTFGNITKAQWVIYHNSSIIGSSTMDDAFYITCKMDT